MNRYATLQVITREFRASAETDHDVLLGSQCVAAAREAGHTPVGEPLVEWRPIHFAETMIDDFIISSGGREDDWFVRASVEIAESEALPGEPTARR